MGAKLQIALDFLELSRALKVAREAVAGGAHILEAGTPLIKSEGLDAVRSLRREFPKKIIVADMKTMDAGRIEMEAAAKAGADVAVVMGTASPFTVRECIEAGKNYGIQVEVDLLGVKDPVEFAVQAQKWGATIIGIHCAIDDQMLGKDPFDCLKKVREKIDIPIAVAGGINSETAADAVAAGASIVVVGGAIAKAEDAEKATREVLNAMETGIKIPTALFKRVSLENIRKILSMVSSPNVSDAMHRTGELKNLLPLQQGTQMVGKAVTVRTCPGDWAKPVEAVDVAEPGDIIVIDAGGKGPAVWGELATESCLQRGIAGVVIDGAVRDVDTIRKLRFQVFAREITPAAGEPKGFGEIGVPVKVGGVEISPGDWLKGDDSGLVRIPRGWLVETANRAMDVLEKENRIRKEIREGGTLSSVTELLRWEKERGGEDVLLG